MWPCLGEKISDTISVLLKGKSSLLGLVFFSLSGRERVRREGEMGNCQAIDAASLVIQHTNGREERLYWPVMAKEIMRLNPGYYVALIITYHVSEEQQRRSSNPYSNSNPNTNNGVRITRVKLLRPSDSLTLGQAYKLIDSQGMFKF